MIIDAYTRNTFYHSFIEFNAPLSSNLTLFSHRIQRFSLIEFNASFLSNLTLLSHRIQRSSLIEFNVLLLSTACGGDRVPFSVLLRFIGLPLTFNRRDTTLPILSSTRFNDFNTIIIIMVKLDYPRFLPFTPYANSYFYYAFIIIRHILAAHVYFSADFRNLSPF